MSCLLHIVCCTTNQMQKAVAKIQQRGGKALLSKLQQKGKQLSRTSKGLQNSLQQCADTLSVLGWTIDSCQGNSRITLQYRISNQENLSVLVIADEKRDCQQLGEGVELATLHCIHNIGVMSDVIKKQLVYTFAVCSVDCALVPIHLDGAVNVSLLTEANSCIFQKNTYTGRSSLFLPNRLCDAMVDLMNRNGMTPKMLRILMRFISLKQQSEKAAWCTQFVFLYPITRV